MIVSYMKHSVDTIDEFLQVRFGVCGRSRSQHEIEIEIMPTAYLSDAARHVTRDTIAIATRPPKVRQMHPGQRFEIQIDVAASESPGSPGTKRIHLVLVSFFLPRFPVAFFFSPPFSCLYLLVLDRLGPGSACPRP